MRGFLVLLVALMGCTTASGGAPPEPDVIVESAQTPPAPAESDVADQAETVPEPEENDIQRFVRTAPERWCEFHATEDAAACLSEARTAMRHLVRHLNSIDESNEAEFARAAKIFEDCGTAFADKPNRTFDVSNVWQCIIDTHRADAVVARLAAEQRQRRWWDRVEQYGTWARELCRERNPGSEYYCDTGQYLGDAAVELTNYEYGELPRNVELPEEVELAPIVEECIERARDGELVYAPWATSCIRSTINGIRYRERRSERLRREASD